MEFVLIITPLKRRESNLPLSFPFCKEVCIPSFLKSGLGDIFIILFKSRLSPFKKGEY